MTQELLDRLVRVRQHVDSLEVDTLRADPEKLDAYGNELMAMMSELRQIYEQEMSDFRELDATHEGQLGQEDLNALEETLEAASETAEILAELRARDGHESDAEEQALGKFDESLHNMHGAAEVLAAEEEVRAEEAE